MPTKQPRIPVTLSDEERADIDAAKHLAGIRNVSTFLRMAALKWAREINRPQ